LPRRGESGGQAELHTFEKFCGGLTLSQGGPLLLEPFQKKILADYFDGVIETLVLLSKKNGKTTLMAAIALYHLLFEPDADCVIGASTREQASIMYEQAVGFVRRSERLSRLFTPKGGYRAIHSNTDAGRVRVLAADVDHADGVIPTLALVDELGRHKKPDLYGVFRDGLGARNGQMFGISAAGEHEGTPLGVIRREARRLPTVTEGRYSYSRDPTGTFALHEWALHEDDDLHDLELVKSVNPLANNTLEKLRQRHDSPSMLSWQWARFACGIWLAADLWWISPSDWTACEVDRGLAEGDRITIGFDGSRYHDATAIVGCRIEDGCLQLLHLWEAPKGASDWEVPGPEVDARLAEVMERYKVVRGYFDPPLWQSEIDAWSHEWGEQLVLRFWTNRARMMAAAERFRTDLVEGKVPHVADSDLTRHITNTQLREVRGGYLLTKGRGEQEANDAAVAAVLAYEARCDLLANAKPERSRVPVSW
jgi:phage terminase large subunit-like protein